MRTEQQEYVQYPLEIPGKLWEIIIGSHTMDQGTQVRGFVTDLKKQEGSNFNGGPLLIVANESKAVDFGSLVIETSIMDTILAHVANTMG